MIATWLILFSTITADPSADYPYTAVVITDEAEVRAGSGRRFYVTDRLKKGTRVEVHRQDGVGYYAIRPPEGSFSWVPAEQVNLTDDPDVAEVTSEETVSWIGSRVEKIRDHRYQIELKVGERVEILGEKKITTEAGAQVWYKIAPPAGEFRWIHARDIRGVLIVGEPAAKSIAEPAAAKSLTTVIATPSSAESSSQGFRPRGKVELKDLGKEESVVAKLTRDEEPRPIRPTYYADDSRPPSIPAVDITAMERTIAKENSPNIKTDGFVPRGTKWSSNTTPEARDSSPVPTKPPEPFPIGSGLASRPLSGDRLLSQPNPNAITTSKRLSRQELDAELAAIDAELALMVANDPKTWNLARLRLRVEQLVDQGESATDRGRARLLVEKIHKFAETFGVEDNPRYAGLATANTSVANDKVVGTGAREAGASSALDPKYDGQGWLKPVIAHNKPAAAPFAIVDKDGKPVAFVTPAPGLNLNLYKDRRVGLYGRQGYLEALRTPHITAERVIDLDRHLRR